MSKNSYARLKLRYILSLMIFIIFVLPGIVDAGISQSLIGKNVLSKNVSAQDFINPSRFPMPTNTPSPTSTPRATPTRRPNGMNPYQPSRFPTPTNPYYGGDPVNPGNCTDCICLEWKNSPGSTCGAQGGCPQGMRKKTCGNTYSPNGAMCDRMLEGMCLPDKSCARSPSPTRFVPPVTSRPPESLSDCRGGYIFCRSIGRCTPPRGCPENSNQPSFMPTRTPTRYQNGTGQFMPAVQPSTGVSR